MSERPRSIPIFREISALPQYIGLLSPVEATDYGTDSEGWSIRYDYQVRPFPEEFAGLVEAHSGSSGKLVKADLYLYKPDDLPLTDAADVETKAVRQAFDEAVSGAVLAAERGIWSKLALVGTGHMHIPATRESPNWLWAGMRVRQSRSFRLKADRVSHLALCASGGWLVKVRYTYPEMLAPRSAFTAFLLFLFELEQAIDRFSAGQCDVAVPDRTNSEWKAAVASILEAKAPLASDPAFLGASEAGLSPPSIVEVRPPKPSDEHPKEALPELAYLGNGQGLTIGGLQVPNPAVLRLLNDGDVLKSLLLIFDGLVVVGLAPDADRTDDFAVSLAPVRPFQLGPESLYAEVSCRIDEISHQLIETGLLQCVEPASLVQERHVNELLDRFIAAACELAGETYSAAGSERIWLDAGPLGPLMDEDTVLWVFEELAKLDLAEIHQSADFVRAVSKADGKEYSGAGTKKVFQNEWSLLKQRIAQASVRNAWWIWGSRS